MKCERQTVAVVLALCLALVAHAQVQTNIIERPEIERLREETERRAHQKLDRDASAVIEDTGKTVRAIAANKPDEARAAIESAIAKINALAARYRAKELLPVSANVEIIETAPLDIHVIRQQAKGVEDGVQARDYPRARILLDGLRSEIRIRTSHLPLETYPNALQQAARLLDEKRTNEVRKVLLSALHTLVLFDQIKPLPIALAQTAIDEAQALQTKDKEKAGKLLTIARFELERAKELGYAGKDPIYASLNRTISRLEKQLKGNENTASGFAKLKEMVASFFNQQSEIRRPS